MYIATCPGKGNINVGDSPLPMSEAMSVRLRKKNAQRGDLPPLTEIDNIGYNNNEVSSSVRAVSRGRSAPDLRPTPLQGLHSADTPGNGHGHGNGLVGGATSHALSMVAQSMGATGESAELVKTVISKARGKKGKKKPISEAEKRLFESPFAQPVLGAGATSATSAAAPGGGADDDSV